MVAIAIFLLCSMLLLTGFKVRSERQAKALRIITLAHELGLEDTDPIIVRATEILNEEETPENHYDFLLSTYDSSFESDAIILAKVTYGEARGVSSVTEQACIAWTILNRVDSPQFGSTISAVASAPHQFAYNCNAPTVDDYGRDLLALARDIICRWQLEKRGVDEVGRVLPADYFYYGGDGTHNYFRKTFQLGEVWHYELPTPYES